MTEALNFILRFFRQRKPWVAGLRYDGRKPGVAPSGSFSAAFNMAGRLLVRGRWPRIWWLLPILVVAAGSSPSFGLSRDVIFDFVTIFQSALLGEFIELSGIAAKMAGSSPGNNGII
jgi:hypothetical protein